MPHRSLHKCAITGSYNFRQLQRIVSQGVLLVSELLYSKILQILNPNCSFHSDCHRTHTNQMISGVFLSRRQEGFTEPSSSLLFPSFCEKLRGKGERKVLPFSTVGQSWKRFLQQPEMPKCNATESTTISGLNCMGFVKSKGYETVT